MPRRKPRSAARLTREQLQVVFDNVDVGVGLTTAAGETLSLNPAGLRIHGFASEDEMFSRLDDYVHEFELRYPDGTPIPVADWPTSRAQRGETVRDFDVWLHNRVAGESKYVSYSVTPLRDRAGKTTHFVFNMTDLTARKRADAALLEAEARFRTLADNIPQLAWMAGASGHLFWYNRRWYDYSGTTEHEMAGWGWQKLHHPEHLERVTARWKRSLETGEPWEDVFPLRGADGEWRWFLSRALPIREGGRIVRWFGTNTDVTDELRRQEELKQALVARDEFLSVASHELKTPLTSMLLKTDILQRRLDLPAPATAGDMRAYLDAVRRQVGRLNRLVDDMLDVTRIGAGRLSLYPERFALDEVVREVVERMAADFDKSRTPLAVGRLEHVEGTWDRLRVEQVITNLLSNALRYGQQRPVTVEVRREGGAALLSVADQGLGIEAAEQERVFERFERAAGRVGAGGLGLGLFITRRIAEQHGGRAWVESEGAGRGSTFFVSLPA